MIFLTAALAAFILTSLMIPLTIKLALKYQLVDNPRLRPHPAHIQKRTVPRAGGLALFWGIVIPLFLFLPISSKTWGITAGLLILLVVGILDDKYHHLSPYLRLISQFLAALVVVLSGLSINFITNPLGGIINLDSLNLPIDFLAIIWIVWVMNMINWSKGVDGQMPAVVMVAAIILGLLSVKFYLSGDLGQIDVATLSFITAGASFAFLLFNWYPAKIFPGFSGSTILGFMLSVLAILAGAKLATATLVLLIPATDFAYTFFRRILQGRSPVWGDRGHLHHKLIEAGFTHRQISLFYLFGSAMLGAAALSLSSQGKLFAGILVATIIFGAILWLNFFGGYSKKPDPDNG
ncbi:hypothetical protein A3B45_02460 [Candidatus Daviesbacteria bacterium RIFCSPLOWO2_01_FULL_39_12]|uniref:Undecaprenyl-phosphate alpha-N-acetylglucosaminyl 1-phosphate transferase n=1 Tax=Candidatus Daviesbacteria bacterium RIFCSPLOWO2_01_FULL_39_12 TaxID=1797785 RepID=A0A1F5KSR5_9BACT|nr:MAG: hypothetical protein A3B45_02460 [Candidatus Daviesbacteria bacterium RIFCSPLOWO2_01_FULL_39_12]